jgi:hypothetical protein
MRELTGLAAEFTVFVLPVLIAFFAGYAMGMVTCP